MSIYSCQVAVIGAGPAGLMAAQVLAEAGLKVTVFEQMPSAARKFLMAGKTGLNISHNENFEQFMLRYADASAWLRPMIQQCDADFIRQWMKALGIESYVGSSGRIFPIEMKAAPLLKAWLRYLKSIGVTIKYRHRWLGWQQYHLHLLNKDQPVLCATENVLLATGAASWQRLGSDGRWCDILSQQNNPPHILDFEPSNVGIEVKWSDFLHNHFGQPLKRVSASIAHKKYHGEAVITAYGLEGGLIYQLNAELRPLLRHTTASIYFDLLPDISADQLLRKFKTFEQNKKLNTLRIWQRIGLDNTKIALLREYLAKSVWRDPEKVVLAIKHCQVSVESFRPLDEAISCAGGLDLKALDKNMMLKNTAAVFCCGEMLDWDAPTGGYLLTACLATGRQAAQGILNYQQSKNGQQLNND